jgi:GTP-binding protein Era
VVAEQAITRSGFVALLGRPNVGKSTLLNRLLGEKIAITSPKPQTTRNRVAGVVNLGECQIVFFDTPGVHESARLINRYMSVQALSTLGEVDAALLLVDARQQPTGDDEVLAERIRQSSVPALLVVNKTDAGRYDAAEFRGLLPEAPFYEVSALTGKGVGPLLADIAARMPEGPAYYPDDILTDRPERFIAAEYIREKVFLLTGEEVPYSVAVTVEAWEDKPEQNLAVIHATLHVERDSQKGILVGRGGKLVKEIGRRARLDLEKLLGCRVFLDLHVAVEHNWTKDPRQLKRFGYES